jgi:hypothetical protein
MSKTFSILLIAFLVATVCRQTQGRGSDDDDFDQVIILLFNDLLVIISYYCINCFNDFYKGFRRIILIMIY